VDVVRDERHGDPITTTVEELTAHLARLCPENRIDLAGAVALPVTLPHRDKWRSFLADERHGDLEYLTRDPDGRLDPTGANPWTRSLLVFAQRYTVGWPAADTSPVSGGPPGDPARTPWTDRVSRYARGLDYHDVFLKDIKKVVAGLREVWPDLAAFPVTDTGPYLEREYAWLAGLGFLGKNTCLIHEKLGSGLFLGVAPTNLSIAALPAAGTPQPEPLYVTAARRRQPPERAAASHCGSCTACIDACPTAALLPGGGMDANACLSTWTIEWRGGTPEGRRREQGGILFGCDICQAVCPWNTRAAARPRGPDVREEYGVRPEHAEITLADLLDLTDDDFRQRFRRTPLWRCHPAGLRANARVVWDNLTEGERS
jgi:epoxyqueuosine reductase